MIPQAYASRNPCHGLAGANRVGASSCRVSGTWVRRSAISSGATAIQDNQ
jgi:hypothetical protein